MSPSGLLSMAGHALSASGWERTSLFPKSNLIFNWQHIPVEGLRQAIIHCARCPLRPSTPGPYMGRTFSPHGPPHSALFWKAGDHCTVVVFQTFPVPGRPVQIRFSGLVLHLLHQQHQRKGLEITRFKQGSRISPHWTSLWTQFSGNSFSLLCKRQYIQRDTLGNQSFVLLFFKCPDKWYNSFY